MQIDKTKLSMHGKLKVSLGLIYIST